MGFSGQEYWSGLSCPPPGDLPDPGMEPTSPALQVDFITELPGKPRCDRLLFLNCFTNKISSKANGSIYGEGNGNPLQCSCLENPRDGGAWWAAIYGVAQNQTRLKRLSSSTFTALDYAYSLRSCLLQRILKTCEVFCGREVPRLRNENRYFLSLSILVSLAMSLPIENYPIFRGGSQ